MSVSLGAVQVEDLPLPVVYYPNHYGTFFGFSNRNDSKVYLCACTEPLIANLFRLISASREQWASSVALNHYFPDVIADALKIWNRQDRLPLEFASRLCHRCNLATPTLRYCHEMYGTRFIQSFGWYVNQAYLRLGMLPEGAVYLPDVCPPEYQEEIIQVQQLGSELDLETERLMAMAGGPKREDISESEITYWRNVRHEDAQAMVDLRRRYAKAHRAFTTKIENITRQEFGFRNVGEGWVSETLMYQIVKRLLPDHEVLFHHRPTWLQGLEIDVFVPALKLGLEYQGAQHFRPIKAWGGEKALAKVKQHDAMKRSLCREHGVNLVEIDYTDALTENLVGGRIASYLHSQ